MSSSMVVAPPSLAVRAHTPTAWFLATVGNSSAVNRYTVAKAAAAACVSIRAANEPSAKFSQSRKRTLIVPSPG